jgi:secondary thiamine-phosphate synthase enzyme
MLQEIAVRTRRRIELVDITAEAHRIVAASGVPEGICHLFVPHTTAAVTLNEKADPDVARDVEAALARIVPADAGYRHAEGNSDAHIKSSIVGASVFVPVARGDLVLGTWQAIFFCEFDGPRSRRCLIRIIPAEASPGGK